MTDNCLFVCCYKRDNIGIGGSWSEFVDYLTTSLKSGDVKLIMDGVLESGGNLIVLLILSFKMIPS